MHQSALINIKLRNDRNVDVTQTDFALTAVLCVQRLGPRKNEVTDSVGSIEKKRGSMNGL